MRLCWASGRYEILLTPSGCYVILRNPGNSRAKSLTDACLCQPHKHFIYPATCLLHLVGTVNLPEPRTVYLRYLL